MARTIASENRQSTDHRANFRGYCLYKTGKCKEERALKTNGLPHNLCNFHRLKQNQNQRKLDWKIRQNTRNQRGEYYDESKIALQTPRFEHHYVPPSYQMDRDAYRTHVLKQLVRLVSEEILATELPFASVRVDSQNSMDGFTPSTSMWQPHGVHQS